MTRASGADDLYKESLRALNTTTRALRILTDELASLRDHLIFDPVLDRAHQVNQHLRQRLAPLFSSRIQLTEEETE